MQIRKIFCLLLASLSLMPLKAQGYDHDNLNFIAGSVYTYADRVNMRSEPGLDGKVLKTLPHGSLLVPLDIGKEMDTLNGIPGRWSYVLHEGTKGYIWQELLTFRAARSHADPHVLFLFDSQEENQLSIKVLKDGVLQQELQQAISKPTVDFAIFSHLGSGGVEGITDLFEFNFQSHECGGQSTKLYLAYDGKKLQHFFTEEMQGDIGEYEFVELIFPYELQGEKDVLLLVDQQVEEVLSEDESEVLETIYHRDIRKRMRWNGSKLVEVSGPAPAQVLPPLSYIFADKVNIREKPSLDSRVIATLSEGTPYLHKDVLSDPDTIGGKVDHWIKIEYKGQEAFVWRPLTATFAARSQSDADYLFLFGSTDKFWEGHVKVLHKGKLSQDFVLPLPKPTWGDGFLQQSGNFGVVGVNEFVAFDFPGYACGKASVLMRLAFDGTKLHHFYNNVGVGDGGFFEHTLLLLPSEPQGEPDKLLEIQQAGEHLWNQEDRYEGFKMETNTVRRMRWIGTELVEY